jgi:hypothetical protein
MIRRALALPLCRGAWWLPTIRPRRRGSERDTEERRCLPVGFASQSTLGDPRLPELRHSRPGGHEDRGDQHQHSRMKHCFSLLTVVRAEL